VSGWKWKPNTAAIAKIREAAEEGAGDATEIIFKASQDLVPVDEGDLLASGRIEGEGLHRTIRYTDPVAAIAHEDMRANHTNGQSKFLETAMNTKKDEARAAIATSIRRVTS
jgi:hypothetical protein